jgi:anti-sigma factor RsiW
VSTEHRTIRESLGAYVLGHLDDDGVVALHAHLDGCADCRAEVAELGTVVPALRGVDPSALDATPTPPPDLGDRVLEQARAEGRPRARRRAMLVAAGAVAIALAGGAGFLLGAGTGATPAVPREVVEVRAMAPGVQASAVAIPHTWGVEITLDADGFATGQVYRVVVRDDAGRAESAGEFVGTGDAGMRCNLNSSVLRADASGFDVLDGQGAVVVHGDL